MQVSLDGKVAEVNGGSTAANGARVVVTGRDKTPLTKLLPPSDRCTAVAADVSKLGDLQTLS